MDPYITYIMSIVRSQAHRGKKSVSLPLYTDHYPLLEEKGFSVQRQSFTSSSFYPRSIIDWSEAKLGTEAYEMLRISKDSIIFSKIISNNW